MTDRQSITWAKKMLAYPNAVILDTETTGLGSHDQAIQISIIDMRGNALFDSLIKPTVPVSSGAAAIHGIGDEQLATAPTLAEVWERIESVLDGKSIITYNSSFDFRMLYQTIDAQGDGDQVLWLYAQDFHCAMHKYSAFVGEASGRGGYKWQKLPGGDHSALGDCRATLAVIRRMAEAGE